MDTVALQYLPNLDDPRFVGAVLIAAVSGAARGFSGFGSALIYVPLMSAVYSPRIAAPSFLLVDFAAGLAFLPTVLRRTHWNHVLPMAGIAVATCQLGALILFYADPTLLRWIICLAVWVVLASVVAGWRYHGRPRPIVTVAVGFIAGIFGGAVQISGPPVIMYWLSSRHDMMTIRANLGAYFALFAIGSSIIYAFNGLVSAEVLALTAVLVPVHVGAMLAGSLLVRRASEQVFRRIAYVMIFTAALISMPVLDGSAG